MFSKCVVLCALAVITASARTVSVAEENIIPQETPRSQEPSSLLSDVMYAYNLYKKCDGDTSCLKLKLIVALDRASRSVSDLSILGIKFVKNADAPEVPPPQSEPEIDANLPRSMEEREDKLDGLIADKIGNFLATHSLQLQLPSVSDLQRSFTEEEEGRGKKKKMSGLLLLPLILGGTLIPIALGGLALIAGKALLTAKVALVLAGIIAFKKLFGSHKSAIYPHESHEVVVPSSSGWGRSYEKDAQNIAYRAYAPKPKEQ